MGARITRRSNTYHMLNISSTNVVTLTGLYDSVSAAYVNDATVTAVLKDSDGATVYSFSLSYVTSSNGNYRGSIPHATTATLEDGAKYSLEVTIVSGSNQLFMVEPDWAGYAA